MPAAKEINITLFSLRCDQVTKIDLDLFEIFHLEYFITSQGRFLYICILCMCVFSILQYLEIPDAGYLQCSAQHTFTLAIRCNNGVRHT